MVPSSATSNKRASNAIAPDFQSHSADTSLHIPVIAESTPENEPEDDEDEDEDDDELTRLLLLPLMDDAEEELRLAFAFPASHSPAHGTKHGYTKLSACALLGYRIKQVVTKSNIAPAPEL